MVTNFFRFNLELSFSRAQERENSRVSSPSELLEQFVKEEPQWQEFVSERAVARPTRAAAFANCKSDSGRIAGYSETAAALVTPDATSAPTLCLLERPRRSVFVMDLGDLRITAARFAQKKLSNLLDTRSRGGHHHAEVSLFEARLPLLSPNAVSVKDKLRIERQQGRTF